MTDVIKAMFDQALFGDGKPRPASGLLVVAPVQYAIYEASRKFYGRDWRRVKREVRKAERLAVRSQPPIRLDRSESVFWRGIGAP